MFTANCNAVPSDKLTASQVEENTATLCITEVGEMLSVDLSAYDAHRLADWIVENVKKPAPFDKGDVVTSSVLNGEVGIVSGIDTNGKRVKILTSDGYTFTDASTLTLVYRHDGLG